MESKKIMSYNKNIVLEKIIQKKDSHHRLATIIQHECPEKNPKNTELCTYNYTIFR